MSGYAQAIARFSDLRELPFEPADVADPIVHRIWASAYGAGERLEHHRDGSVRLMEFIPFDQRKREV